MKRFKNGNERNWKSDKKLTKGEITLLKRKGFDIHALKGKNASRYDLFKDAKGNIYKKRKDGQEHGEYLDINIKKIVDEK